MVSYRNTKFYAFNPIYTKRHKMPTLDTTMGVLTKFVITCTYINNSRWERNNNNTKIKKVKIADLVLSSLFMRDNEKCNISHVP